MQINTLSEIILPDGVIRYQMEIPSASFLYVGFLLESFEGVCIYTTPDKKKNIMQIDVVPHYKEQFLQLLKALKEFDITK
jgi:hypothetical protein